MAKKAVKTARKKQATKKPVLKTGPKVKQKAKGKAKDPKRSEAMRAMWERRRAAAGKPSSGNTSEESGAELKAKVEEMNNAPDPLAMRETSEPRKASEARILIIGENPEHVQHLRDCYRGILGIPADYVTVESTLTYTYEAALVHCRVRDSYLRHIQSHTRLDMFHNWNIRLV